jgi:hypothetical protein
MIFPRRVLYRKWGKQTSFFPVRRIVSTCPGGKFTRNAASAFGFLLPLGRAHKICIVLKLGLRQGLNLPKKNDLSKSPKNNKFNFIVQSYQNFQ